MEVLEWEKLRMNKVELIAVLREEFAQYQQKLETPEECEKLFEKLFNVLDEES
jgi:hypothetical protein